MVNEAELHESSRAMLAAVRAVQARQSGKPYNKALVPQQESATSSIEDIFPGIDKQLQEQLAALRAEAFTVEKKATPVSLSAASRDYHAGLPHKLFEIAIEKCALTMLALKQSRGHIAELTGRLAALEKQTTVLQHRGAFKAGKEYSSGVFLTHGGALWLTTRSTFSDERPGASDAFRLVVKSGHAHKVFE